MFKTTTLHPPLYKRGVKGEVRVWRLELGADHPDHADQAGYRSISGILDGTMVESGWSLSTPKNVGKKNATSSLTQAEAEVAAEYVKKQDRGYWTDIADIDTPVYTKPMLAQDWDKRKSKVLAILMNGVWSQPKLDGIRCIARADGLWTRNGKPIVAVPHVFEDLQPLFASDPDLVLDGELYNHDLKDDFNAITSAVRKTKPKPEDFETARVVQYHVYDMPSHTGTFSERIRALADATKLLHKHDTIRIVETFRETTVEGLDELYGEWLEAGYEGQMIRLDETYDFKRSNSLIKRKEFTTEEFPVLAVEEGNGNWLGCVKRFIVRLPSGIENEAGVRGTQAALRELLESGKTPDWATVRYFGYTPAGKLRFPVVVDWGWGKRVD